MNVLVAIPFRDRGRDPLRQVNLLRILEHWDQDHQRAAVVASDGRDGDQQFNRSAAYNKAVRDHPDVDVFVFTESDMLINPEQIEAGIELAAAHPGQVVPFTEYHYLTPEDSHDIRNHAVEPEHCTPETIMTNGRSHGAINIISRESLRLVGQYDELFEGNWYDDTAMKIAYTKTCGPTRFIPGPAHHLYHLPGWTGDHLTDQDRAATRRNHLRCRTYRMAQTPDRIRHLTAGGQ